MKRYAIFAGIALVLLAVAYSAGRFTAPAKVVEKVVVREVKVTDTATTKTAAPVRVVKVTRFRPAPATPVPAGCPECPPIRETTVTIEKGPVVTTTEKHEDISSVFTKTVLTEREYPRLTLGVGAASRIVDPLGVGIAGMANYRFAGPVGAWVAGANLGGGTVFLGVSVTF